MLVDANILLYAVDRDSPFHQRSHEWLTTQLNGSRRVGLPWQSLTAFARIVANPRASRRALSPDEAWTYIDGWLRLATTWIPTPTEGHAAIFGGLVRAHQLRANLIPDAHLAALAIEHGLTLCSADSDFARFDELTWQNPLSPAH